MYQFPNLRIPASLPTVTKSLLWNFWEIPNLHFLSCNLVFFTKWVGKNEHVSCGEAVMPVIRINKTGHGYLRGSQEALFSRVSQAPTVCSGLWLWKLILRFWVCLHDRYVIRFRMQGLEGHWEEKAQESWSYDLRWKWPMTCVTGVTWENVIEWDKSELDPGYTWNGDNLTFSNGCRARPTESSLGSLHCCSYCYHTGPVYWLEFITSKYVRSCAEPS